MAAIGKKLKDTSTIYPSPRTVPFTPQSESGRNIPEVQLAGADIVSAASQLISVVRPPPLTLIASVVQVNARGSSGLSTMTFIPKQFHVPTALRIAIRSHTAEILRTAGTQVL
jgi:hypothetical protein